MVVGFPLDLVYEVYLGRWVNVTALAEGRSLRQVEPVRVSWGMPNEQSKALAPPSTVEAVLNNTGGHWTPGNPMSDYYDYLRARNAPTRLSLRVSRDTFSRTVPVDWGFSDTGDGWSTATSGSGTASVASGVGKHSQPNAGAYVVTFVGDSYGDCQAAITGAWNLDVAGGALEPVNLVQRFQPSGTFAGEHYLLRVSVSTAEVLTVAIFHSTLGALTSALPISNLTPGANTVRAKFQAEGQTLRGKVYFPGPSNDPDQFEPLGWHVSAHHERLTGGFPGVRTGVAAGNSNTKPIVVDYDEWDLRLVRHSGELTKLDPMGDATHRIKKATVRSAGVTQRLGRPQRPTLSSAPRRYLATNAEFSVSDAWLLDEAATAPAQGLNLIAGGAAARFERTAGVPDLGGIEWGQTDATMPVMPGFPVVSNQGGLRFIANQAVLGSSFAHGWMMRLSPDEGAQVFISTAAQVNRFVFFFYTDGTWELFRNPGSVTLQTGTFDLPAGLGGQWIPMTFTTYPSGGSTVYRITANGINQGGGTTAVAYSPLANWLFYAPGAPAGGVTGAGLGSVFVTPTPLDTVTTLVDGRLGVVGEKVAQVLRGWIGERSLLRAFRLCAEEGVPLDYWGDPGITPPMGPQKPAPLLDLLTECAEADQAFIYEPRYTAGIAIRSRRSMVARPVDVSLSYSAGHVAPPLRLSADDRPTANLIRAERVGGGVVFVEQTSGVMNTKDPGTDPEAVGRSPADVKVNAEADAQLPYVGGWARALGTTPELRVPRVTVNLVAKELTTGPDPTLPARQVLAATVGSHLLVTGTQAADLYRDLDQMIRGGLEIYRNVRQHEVTLYTAPYEKWRAGVFGDGTTRFDTAGSTFASSLTTSYTGTISLASVGPPWTTAGANFPLNVECEGEVITLSGISGGSSPQTATISARSVNGVVKAHGAGASLRLATAYYHC